MNTKEMLNRLDAIENLLESGLKEVGNRSAIYSNHNSLQFEGLYFKLIKYNFTLQVAVKSVDFSIGHCNKSDAFFEWNPRKLGVLNSKVLNEYVNKAVELRTLEIMREAVSEMEKDRLEYLKKISSEV